MESKIQELFVTNKFDAKENTYKALRRLVGHEVAGTQSRGVGDSAKASRKLPPLP